MTDRAETLSTEEIADIAAVFYKQLRAATTNTNERVAITTIVQILAQLEAANGQ